MNLCFYETNGQVGVNDQSSRFQKRFRPIVFPFTQPIRLYPINEHQAIPAEAKQTARNKHNHE